MTDFVPAEAFPPGEFLSDELEERGWTQKEFADLTGLPPRYVSEIIAGKRGLSPEAAIRFSAALGTSAQFWMNLDTAYRLYELRRTAPAPAHIAQEAKLRERFPVRELLKRGWVKESEDAKTLEARVLRFYGRGSVDEDAAFSFAAKRREESGTTAQLQEAWLYRVKQVAEGIHVGKYSEQELRISLARLSGLRSAPEEARHVPRILAECGVRFVIVEPIPGSKIDGACFWLKGGALPVIGMSLRIDRIDDVILEQIRAARFIVADFSGHRGGVYFEAGFAKALGIPVIWTCRQSDMAGLHFDIRQYNCIEWSSAGDLASKLARRISTVIGPGPRS